ncbi:MAG: NAD-dependent malic enzyme, partial [Candidatus Micrarchaeota archaeon]|nr:NAD-dependent malic enzyme [Candidatus Micrarchaeota archaeon]
AHLTPGPRCCGTLDEVIEGADVFIGASVPKSLTGEQVKKMAPHPVVFALANPVPEISREEAMAAGAAAYASGRSDTPNQINNVLAFPGLFRGLLDCRAKKVSLGMKLAAAGAIADLAREDGLKAERIVPDPFDKRLKGKISQAVMDAARKEGLARA